MTNEEAWDILDAFPHFNGEQDTQKIYDAVNTALRALKQNKALLLLVEWAEECGFGYDNIPWLYAKYKREIENKNMGYTEGLIYIAEQEAENGTSI